MSGIIMDEIMTVRCIVICRRLGLELVKILKSYRGYYCLVGRQSDDRNSYAKVIVMNGKVKSVEYGMSVEDVKFDTLCIEG